MPTRRDFLRTGLLAGGGALIAPGVARAQLCAPQNDPNLPVPASPPVDPFSVPLPIPPVLQPVESLDPPPDPAAHQRYDEFPPVAFYEIHVTESPHAFAPNYQASPIFGYNGIYPGPTVQSVYGEPILVRIYNDLPLDAVGFGIPSITTHLHNFHTASESDGGPPDFHGPGTYHDHHYAMYPAGGDPREIMNTLWYHDHRQDFTAANVVRGLAGFFIAFDDLDTGDENDPRPGALRLPSGEFDVPMVFVDRVFDQSGVQTFDTFNTDGTLGDRFGVNGTIQPFFQVRRRKYRFRLLNAGPSRFYQFFLSSGQPFIQLSSDGNLLPAPIRVNSVPLSVAERVDVIIDFANARVGDQIFLVNRLEQISGRGPTYRVLSPGDRIVRFDVVSNDTTDPSQVPATLRELPPIDLSGVTQERLWQFDYVGGTWLINGKTFDANRVDAAIRTNSAEIWTFRNEGFQWSHPIHAHLEESQIIERNGRKVRPQARRDVITLHPNDEIKIYMQFRDWLGRYPLHCHNVVHEDHSMMGTFEIVP